jgi:predicted GNAT family N-acyltransferase
MGPSFLVRRADWNRDREHLRRIREAVFVQEQRVPLELEWDSLDEACLHVLAVDPCGVPIGTGRLLPDGHIGRMAVLASWRRRGVGAALLTELTRMAIEQGFVEVILNAQVQAMGFYARHGFVAEGEEFLDAGIAHVRMRRALT